MPIKNIGLWPMYNMNITYITMKCMERVMPQAQHSNQDLDLDLQYFFVSLQPGSIIFTILIRMKVLPTNQHESFQHVFFSLTCILAKFSRGHPTQNCSKLSTFGALQREKNEEITTSYRKFSCLNSLLSNWPIPAFFGLSLVPYPAFRH